jgi:hypothetical protein
MEKKERSQGSPSSSFPRKTPRGVEKGNEKALVARIRNNPDGTQTLLGVFFKVKHLLTTIPTPCPVYYDKQGKIVEISLKEWAEHFKQSRDLPAWMEYFKNTWPRVFQAIQDNKTEKEKLEAYTLDAVSLTKDREAGIPFIPAGFSKEIEKAIKAKSPLAKLDSLDRLLLENWHKERWMHITLERLGVICGKALKRRPFPKSTMQKRLDALRLQTKVKAGAQPKLASLEAVREYEKQKNASQSIKNKNEISIP